MAARSLGYRVAILDPDPDCPARSVADQRFVAGYSDVAAGLELAAVSDVVTCELEHVGYAVVEAIDGVRLCRPGVYAMRSPRTGWRSGGSSIRSAPRSRHGARSGRLDELRAGAAELGYPLRLKAAARRLRRSEPGPPGGRRRHRAVVRGPRGIGRGRRPPPRAGARVRRRMLGRPRPGRGRSVGRLPGRPQPPRRGDPRRVGRSGSTADRARTIAARARPWRPTSRWSSISRGRSPWSCSSSGMVRSSSTSWHRGSTTAATGRSTAPRRASSSSTSGRSRAAARRPRAHGATAMVNLLGTGARRSARLVGTGAALADRGAHLHVYDKRRGLRAPQDGPRNGGRRCRRTGRCARPGATGRGGAELRGGCVSEDRAERGSDRRDRRRQPIGLPDPRAGGRPAHGARHPVRAPGRVGPPDARLDVPLRRGGRRARAPGHHRRRRRGGSPPRHDRRQDDSCR